MSHSQLIFCLFSGGLLLAIGLLTTTLLSTHWFFIAIGGSLFVLSILQFKRGQPNLVTLEKSKTLIEQK